MSGKASEKFSETFSYKGKEVSIKGSGAKATFTIDDQQFPATQQAGMWRSEGVFNHYKEPADLARHIVDYLHQFTPSQ
jgi:hypothetical protein